MLAFFSRALTKSERNYSTTKRELLAIVFGLLKCRYYIWGRRFTLFTDHRSLQFLLSQREVTPLLPRWFSELMEFSFDIVHIDGVKNILPDALSRLYPVPLREIPVDSMKTVPTCCLRLLPESPDLLITPPEENRHGLLIDAHAFGHAGAAATAKRVRNSGFQWPSRNRDAQDLVKACLPS